MITDICGIEGSPSLINHKSDLVVTFSGGTSRQNSCYRRVGCLLGVTLPNTPVVRTEKEIFGSSWLSLVVGTDVRVS